MLRLRPYKPSDAAHIAAWVADRDTFSAWCGDKLEWPLTAGSLEKHQATVAGRDGWLMTALDETGAPMGFFSAIQADYTRNTVHLGTIIVDPARRGQGVGTALLRLALAYARDILGMERATLRVFDHNAAAMACYRRVGFQAVSLERGCFLHGAERWDCWSMETLL